MTTGSTDQRPLIAVTMGDPAGVGPEITGEGAGEPEDPREPAAQ